MFILRQYLDSENEPLMVLNLDDIIKKKIDKLE